MMVMFICLALLELIRTALLVIIYKQGGNEVYYARN
jgi:hypothetical protein